MSNFSFKEDEETPAAPETKAAPQAAPTPSAPSAPTPNVPLPAVPLPTAQVAKTPAPPGTPSTPGAPTPKASAASTTKPAGAAKPAVPSPPLPGAAQKAAPAAAAKPAQPRSAVPTPAIPNVMSPAQQAAAAKGDPTSGELARAQMQTSGREHVDNKDIPLWRVWLDKLDPLALLLVRVAGAAAVLSVAYLLWGIFGGKIGLADAGSNKQVVQNIAMAGGVLRWALIALAISSIVLMFDVTALGPVLVVIGAFLRIGAPVLVVNSVGDTTAVRALAGQLYTAGLVLFIIGLLKSTLNMAAWLSDLPNRMQKHADVGVGQLAEVAQQRAARNATMFSPCWQLPFCREVIRKQCPAYLAKKRCWKFGRGCYCDEEMISRIIRGESLDIIKAPTRMSRQGKPPCGRCYIFLEHQRLKYQLISPVAIPATILIMFFGWSTYERLFNAVGNSLGAVWAKLSFSKPAAPAATTVSDTPGAPDISIYQMDPEQVQAAALNMSGFLLGFFVLIYLSKLIEWAIYKARM